jgi:hypothetical protein
LGEFMRTASDRVRWLAALFQRAGVKMPHLEQLYARLKQLTGRRQ